MIRPTRAVKAKQDLLTSTRAKEGMGDLSPRMMGGSQGDSSLLAMKRTMRFPSELRRDMMIALTKVRRERESPTTRFVMRQRGSYHWS